MAHPVTTKEIRLFETGEYLVGKWKNSFSALQNQLLPAQNKDTKLLMACEGITVCFFAAAVVFIFAIQSLQYALLFSNTPALRVIERIILARLTTAKEINRPVKYGVHASAGCALATKSTMPLIE